MYIRLARRFFFILFLIHGLLCEAQNMQTNIQLNQLGFYPSLPKLAVVTTPVSNPYFYLLEVKSADTVFIALLSKPIQSLNSSIITRIADFSPFDKAGEYIISVPGAGSSYPFKINKEALHTAAVVVLKGYYFQRVSMPLGPAFAGKWARPAGHPDTSVLVHLSAASPGRPAGTVISTSGGWYDAGGYNKYIVNAGITMGTLLSAYEDFPAYFAQLKTNIPESKNAVPDILDELVYSLRWMLSMQDPGEGGVYNKCTNAAFDGMVMPGVTEAPRYVVQKGAAATLDLTAVAAQSSGVLRPFSSQFPGLADSCVQAALKAWHWAQNNPSVSYDQNEINKTFVPEITTGGYGDNNFTDELFWAACELFATTKESSYLLTVRKGINASFKLSSRNNVMMPGLYTLFRLKNALPKRSFAVIEEAQQRFLAFADTIASGINRSAFKTVMGKSKSDFNWSSNSNAANQGIVLIKAYLLTKNKKYIDQALINLDYILGRNATGYCFVTGLGSKSPMHPHHRQSVSDGIAEPVPGLLAGGANPGKQDKCPYDFSDPETTYSDTDCSYASNEIAINWNAPMVYLANAIETLQHAVGYTNDHLKNNNNAHRQTKSTAKLPV